MALYEQITAFFETQFSEGEIVEKQVIFDGEPVVEGFKFPANFESDEVARTLKSLFAEQLNIKFIIKTTRFSKHKDLKDQKIPCHRVFICEHSGEYVRGGSAPVISANRDFKISLCRNTSSYMKVAKEDGRRENNMRKFTS